jgi:hypothetical protein
MGSIEPAPAALTPSLPAAVCGSEPFAAFSLLFHHVTDGDLRAELIPQGDRVVVRL